MKMLLVFLLLTSSCATFTYRNIDIYDRQKGAYTFQSETRIVVENVISVFGFKQNRTSVMQTQTKVLIDYVISKLGHEKLFERYDFVFLTGWLSQSHFNESMIVGDGLTVLKDKIIYLKVRNCFADSAILHEMSHVIHANGRGNGDQGHLDKAWWNIIDMMNEKMVKKLCPLNYIRDDILPRDMIKIKKEL